MRRFGRDRSATSAIEFALVLPVALALLLGGMELGQELAAARKIVRVARAAADLTSQVAQISTSGVTTVLNAAALTIAPLPTAPLGIIVSEITADANGNTTVTWSKASNAVALTAGSTVSVPQGVVPAGTSAILGQAIYAYTPTFGSAFIPSQTLNSKIYMSPRLSATVDLQ
ncbi:pilus assembly protein [Lichenifustis flavocetrariae]|uniref:Pilus assembly protein n=1 Tax=Lichenifustis flavocetrariae TaxID=2949735 RepID=A0AA41Z4M5_9HYPH|nr:pilus assembly protein [Lichenifustis flavocetrariae]MCW6512926.1 pilus assembly protein [Lichenifustis flavocetrariae]